MKDIAITPSDWPEIEVRVGPVVPVTTVGGATARPDQRAIDSDAVLRAFRLLGRVQGSGRATTMGWGFDVECPWLGEHSDRIASGAVYVPGHQRFQCHHGHCQDRTVVDVRVRLDEMLAEDSGGLITLAGLEFDSIPKACGAMGTSRRPLASYEATEDGLALAFADEHADRLRFDHVRRAWFCWAGWFWRQDQVQYAFRWARNLTRAFRRGLADATTAQIRTLGKIAVAVAVERAGRADAQLATDGLSWDQDPWRVGAPGCEIDLRTGGIELPEPAHMITKQLLVAPADMPTPLWDQFLWDSTGGDLETIQFLQAWSGYNLTGDVSEEKFVFLYGPGGNGKGTYLYTVSAILGDYAARTAADMFMVRKHEAHPEEVARLAGVRAITASEIQEGQTFNAVRLKDFTGRDGKLTGAFKYRDTFEFMPQFKVTFVGNNQPRLTSADDAMKRRVVLLPFLQTPKRVDITLKDRLADEYPGILWWMIQGENLRRAMGGLAALVPASAVAATRQYLDEQDLFRAWAEDRCVFGPAGQMTVRDGFEDYRTWCANNDCHPAVGERQFSRKFLESFPKCRFVNENSVRRLEGVSLSPQNV